MASGRNQVIALYRMLIRESQKFPSYNYRTYAVRRVRSSFRENMAVQNQKQLEELLSRARESLSVVRRQVSVGRLYGAQKTIVEDGGPQ